MKHNVSFLYRVSDLIFGFLFHLFGRIEKSSYLMAGPKLILYVWFCFAHCVTSICLERDFCANGDYRESFLLQSKWVFRNGVFYSTCLVVSSVRGKCLPFLREYHYYFYGCAAECVDAILTCDVHFLPSLSKRLFPILNFEFTYSKFFDPGTNQDKLECSTYLNLLSIDQLSQCHKLRGRKEAKVQIPKLGWWH